MEYSDEQQDLLDRMQAYSDDLAANEPGEGTALRIQGIALHVMAHFGASMTVTLDVNFYGMTANQSLDWFFRVSPLYVTD